MNTHSVTSLKPNSLCRTLTKLTKSGALLPIVLLEGAVTAGRTFHAYKRDGYVEARERFTEESITAVVWLWGVQFFGKIGNFLGKKLLKLPEVNFDVGQDKFRNPIENFSKNKNISKSILARFKFGKIAGAIVAATSFTGFVLPKINQAITRKVVNNQQQTLPQKKVKSPKFSLHIGTYNDAAIKSFAVKGKKEDNVRFASASETLGKLAYKLENDAVYRLLSSDSGLITGRSLNARNEHDRREILIRDIGSLYFYMWAPKHVMVLLNKLSGKSQKLNHLEPINALHLYNHLTAQMAGKSYSAEEFRKFAVGKSELPKAVSAFVEKADDVIIFDEIEKLIPKNLREKALKMTELQPKINGKGVLSKKQVSDIFSTGWISSPEFLKSVYNQQFNGEIENPYKYISQKSVEALRKRIIDFANSISDYAKDKGEKIDKNFLEKINKKNLNKNALFYGAGFAISVFFLSTAIPKFQYYVTKQITGQDKFPGIADYNSKNDKNKKAKNDIFSQSSKI